MKHFGTIAAGLAGALMLNASLRADDAGLPGNPYAVVVARNIFGLNPPVVVDPNATVIEPPVKIVPNGIMSIFGQLQVLFKVAAKPPGKDQSYILTEGQSQDEIEVIKIDEKAGIVTFKNHGIPQELPLVVTAPNSTPAAAVPGGNTGAPKIAPPGLPPPGGTPGSPGSSPFNNRFGNRGGTSGGGRTGGGSGGNPGTGVGFGTGTTGRNNTFNAASQIPHGMTPEVQTVAIEVNRELTKQQVIEGSMPPLPITELTPPDAVGSGGNPLVPSPGAPQ